MTFQTDRRTFLSMMGAMAAAGMVPPAFAAQAAARQALPLGESRPFSFEQLVEEARAMARAPYRPKEPSAALRKALQGIDYDAYQKIRFNPEKALWLNADDIAPVAPFHQHAGTLVPVRLHLVSNGTAREVRYDPSAFDYTGDLVADDMPDDTGWAGFRVLYADDDSRDWLAFMGASYFRSAGPLDQYGLSARAVSIDTGVPGRTEEFPYFTSFWLEPAHEGGIRIHALIESPSLSGAIRIDCDAPSEHAVTMAVSVRLFIRTDIQRLGIAPLTSMFWYSETNRHEARDWRPEVHDNDGLAMWTGSGERIWRPLDNPESTRTTSFLDRNPKGFGLMQRDRDFSNYEDDGVFYDRRPAVWVEPLSPWGEGQVQLLEIPTDDEIHDNIGVYWTTDSRIPAGEERSFDYRLHWIAEPVFGRQPVGHTIATRIGRAGIPGQPRPKDGVKYAIDFAGGELAAFETAQGVVQAAVDATNAKIDNPYAIRVVGTDYWRLIFDLHPEGDAPVDLRAYLHADGRPLTETWIFTHRKPAF